MAIMAVLVLPFQGETLDDLKTQGGAALCPGLVCFGPFRPKSGEGVTSDWKANLPCFSCGLKGPEQINPGQSVAAKPQSAALGPFS
jgi:hypothetical protein